MKTKCKIYAIPISFFVSGLILTAFFIYPTIKDIGKISENITTAKNESFFINSQSDKMGEFINGRGEYENAFEKISRSFVDPDNPVEFIKFLEESARAAGVEVSIDLISLSSGQAENNSEIIVFQVESKGDFSKILEFSERLEVGPYLVKIRDLLIVKSKQQAEDIGKIKVNFTIEAVIERH